MQETKYNDKDGAEQKMREFFSNTDCDTTEKLYEKMNNRLFQLEDMGHSLVQQKILTVSESLAIERAKKAKKKLKRMKKTEVNYVKG